MKSKGMNSTQPENNTDESISRTARILDALGGKSPEKAELEKEWARHRANLEKSLDFHTQPHETGQIPEGVDGNLSDAVKRSVGSKIPQMLDCAAVGNIARDECYQDARKVADDLPILIQDKTQHKGAPFAGGEDPNCFVRQRVEEIVMAYLLTPQKSSRFLRCLADILDAPKAEGLWSPLDAYVLWRIHGADLIGEPLPTVASIVKGLQDLKNGMGFPIGWRGRNIPFSDKAIRRAFEKVGREPSPGRIGRPKEV